MATATKATSATKSGATGTREAKLKPIEKKLVRLTIKSAGVPLVHHNWSEKADRTMREKHAGKKTKNRDVRVPEDECEEATYKTASGKYGVNVRSIKCAILGAAHKDLGIEKTLVKKALFISCDDPNFVVPFVGKQKYEMGEDHVRVGAGSADLRYRPYYTNWSVELCFELDTGLLQMEDLLTLINWAGSRVGIGEMRPEKGGEFGRFVVDLDKPITEEPMRI